MQKTAPPIISGQYMDQGPVNGRWAAVLIDQDGQIENCCPRLFKIIGGDIQHLQGQSVQRLLPNIPIRKETPGYNRAFACFWQNRQGLRQLVISPQTGEATEIEATLSAVPARTVMERPKILVGLRFPCGMMNGDNDLERLERKAENSTKSIMITDRAGFITYVNPAFEQLTGFSQSEAAGKPASLIKSGLHEPGFYTQLWNVLSAGQEFQAVFANRRKSGEIFFEEKRIRPFVDLNGESKYFVAVSHPVNSLLQSTLPHLEKLANHDPLTGLPNRNLFLDRLDQHFTRANRHGTRFALAYIDLDDFKEINDTLGHAAGDAVLKATADHIQNALRNEDTVGRLGGDEFGLILSDTDGENDVKLIIEKVLGTLSRGVLFEGRVLTISASIGVTRYPEGGSDPQSMLRTADSIMYKCKLSGGKGFRIFDTGNKESDEAFCNLPLFANLRQEEPSSDLGKNC